MNRQLQRVFQYLWSLNSQNSPRIPDKARSLDLTFRNFFASFFIIALEQISLVGAWKIGVKDEIRQKLSGR